MFRIDMLPANYGDCLWIEYGDPRRPSRILIDGGTRNAFPALQKRIESVVIKEGVCRFELCVVTHVDADHIGGILRLMGNYTDLGVEFGDLWFNGFRHVVQVRKREQVSDVLGVADGELLTGMIDGHLPWNEHFGGGALAVREEVPLPVVDLDGGMRLTLLTPTVPELMRIEKIWADVVDEEELQAIEQEDLPSDVLGTDQPNVDALAATEFVPDHAVPNGTSISMLAEFEGKRLLLGADAYATSLGDSLARLGEKRPKIDAFKVPHHGSRGNLNTDLLEAIRCNTFLVSTNGVKFKHPNLEAIARIVKNSRPATLYFNYRTKFNRMWDNADLKADYSYEAHYEADGRRVTLAR